MDEVKPFKEYSELVKELQKRGMTVSDSKRAERKISQVGYYRLSGFWYPCREIDTIKNKYNKPKRLNNFLPNTDFDQIFQLYTLDKKLRLLLLDAIERIEINLKTVLAHELGKVDGLAYQSSKFINPTQLKDYYQNNQIKNSWIEWSNRQRAELSRSREDAIIWHKKSSKPIPIWVAVEAWSFGTLSKYFELLKQTYQNDIAARLGVSNPVLLVRWLQQINILRNRCAHHTRIWNQSNNNPVGIPTGVSEDALYFNSFNLTDDSKKKIYSLIIIIWYLVKKIGPNSNWIKNIAHEISNFPDLPIDTKKAMGIPEVGFYLMESESREKREKGSESVKP